MRCLFVCAACLMVSSSYGGMSVEGKLPEDLMPELNLVIDAALEKSETMLMRAFSEEEAEGRRVAARAAVLPSFSSDVAFRQERELGALGGEEFEDRIVYNVTLSQPLYHWGTKRSEKEIGELLYDLEATGTDAARLGVLGSVRSSYMNLVLAKQRLRRVSLDLEEALEDLAIQKDLVEAGSVSESALAALELDIERKELALLQERANWSHNLGGVAASVSLEPATLESLVAERVPEIEVLDQVALIYLRELARKAVGRTDESSGGELGIELERHRLQTEIERRRIQIEENALKPKINAQLGLSSNALDLDGTRQEQEYGYLGLRVKWMIFDGFHKRGKTMEAVSRLGRIEKMKEQAKARFARDLEHKISRLEIAGRRLEIEERVLGSAREQLERIELAIEEQRVSEAERKKYQRHFDNASIHTQSARVDYLRAFGEIVLSLGLDG